MCSCTFVRLSFIQSCIFLLSQVILSISGCRFELLPTAPKYSNIPIPQSEVTLNQSDLISASTNEKTALVEKLKSYLGETSRKTLMENKSMEAEYQNKTLGNVPMLIYIG